MGKLIERMVANQLHVFLDETDSLDPFQLGFRLCHNTKTALVAVRHDLLSRLTCMRATLLVLLDLSATFVRACHSILLERL